MARKPKESPYDSSAGRGTGDFLAGSSATEKASPTRALPMPAADKPSKDPPPNSSLAGAILATLFCFWPLGILAIIYALQVRPRWKRGDETGARHSAEMAEKFTFAAAGVFVIVFVLTLIFGGFYWFFGPRHRF